MSHVTRAATRILGLVCAIGVAACSSEPGDDGDGASVSSAQSAAQTAAAVTLQSGCGSVTVSQGATFPGTANLSFTMAQWQFRASGSTQSMAGSSSSVLGSLVAGSGTFQVAGDAWFSLSGGNASLTFNAPPALTANGQSYGWPAELAPARCWTFSGTYNPAVVTPTAPAAATCNPLTCAGTCVADGRGGQVCQQATAAAPIAIGASCQTDADCHSDDDKTKYCHPAQAGNPSAGGTCQACGGPRVFLAARHDVIGKCSAPAGEVRCLSTTHYPCAGDHQNGIRVQGVFDRNRVCRGTITPAVRCLGPDLPPPYPACVGATVACGAPGVCSQGVYQGGERACNFDAN